MKSVKNIMNESAGFKYIIDELEIMSSSGKKLLYDKKLMLTHNEIEEEITRLSEVISLLKRNAGIFENICTKLAQLRDIHQTISFLFSNSVLNDIDLFEIKQFAILNEEISSTSKPLGMKGLKFEDLNGVITILDPEDQKIPHFYIYSSYSEELIDLRERMKRCYKTDTTLHEELRNREQILEEKIRKVLSKKLFPFSQTLKSALSMLSEYDVIIAKARQAIKMQLCKPEISDVGIEYKSIFNPALKQILESQNNKFQALDIQLPQSPTLITGANMGGKTVLLKTILLSQYMFQFGFFVPAENAKIIPVDEIFINHSENIPEFNGLSSFAAEMININNIVLSVKSGNRVLVLIDELARTTNPAEGKSIVNAMLDFLIAYKVCSIITTHYSNIKSNCNRLRVKGLNINDINNTNLENLNEMMDYSLIHDDTDKVPEEAIRIAEIMKIDKELIDRAKTYYNYN